MMNRQSASGSLSPPATLLLAVYFGFQGALYLIAVAYAGYRFGRENPSQISTAVPGTVVGVLVAILFLRGAFLLRRENRKGLIWAILAFVVIIAQWILDWAVPPGQLLTLFLSLIGVTVSWLELTRKGLTKPSVR